MSQSTKLLVLQVFNIIIGFFSTFWVAGELSPEIFAIIGINEVIISFINVFSNTGLETYAIRNVLYWKEQKNDLKIKEVIIQSIVVRCLLSSCLVLPVLFYVVYISKHKFDGQYLGLFITMAFLSIFSAVNNSVVLLLKSFNRYFLSALITSSISIFGKLLALLLFLKFGFATYIITIITIPVIVTVPILFILKDKYSFKMGLWKENLVDNLKESKHFVFSSYVSYLYNFSDQLIISFAFSAEIIGSLSIGKKVFGIFKMVIENIFDPVIQGFIKFKNDSNRLELEMNKILKIKNVLLLLSIFSLPFVFIFREDFLLLLNLGKYPHLDWFLVSIYISIVVLIELKVKYDFVSLFYSSYYYFKLNLFSAILSIIFLTTILALLGIQYIFLYLGLSYLVMVFYTNFIYQKERLNK